MPYIKPDVRERLDANLERLIDSVVAEGDEAADGVLNYAVSRLVSNVISRLGASGIAVHGDPLLWKYADIARVVAVYECAKLEFYDRIARLKENSAIENNGDIPEYANKRNDTKIVQLLRSELRRRTLNPL